MITIGIVTFSKRFERFKRLIAEIRERTDAPVIACINGNIDGTTDSRYLSECLRFCAENNVHPQSFPTFQGLSKLWNTLVINAPTEHVYLLNDDVDFRCDDIMSRIEARISSAEDNLPSQLFYAPWGWSHFVISKTILDRLGYFDERLLGVGEEDGDMLWRYERAFGIQPGGIEAPGIGNQYDCRTAHDGMDAVYGNKTRFNVMFTYGLKYRPDPSGQKGMFNHPVDQVLPNLQQYPYEGFKRQHGQYIADASSMPIDNPIDPKDFRDFKPWNE